MTAISVGRLIRASIVVALVSLPVGFLGCNTLTAPDPPGGGTRLMLDFAEFDQSVEPVLTRHGCDATGDCHGGGIRGSLRLSPPGAKDVRYDFDQVVLEVSPTVRDSSLILTRPLALAAGGTPHAVKPFASTADSGYQAIHRWILNGVIR